MALKDFFKLQISDEGKSIIRDKSEDYLPGFLSDIFGPSGNGSTPSSQPSQAAATPIVQPGMQPKQIMIGLAIAAGVYLLVKR